MYLANRLHSPLADVDERPWQAVLQRHRFWSQARFRLDADHQDIAFHILVHEGQLARSLKPGTGFEFDAVPIPGEAFDDPRLCELAEGWSAMHAANYGPGVTTKMGLYVVHAGGTLGYHIDGPVFLEGMRADLSSDAVQRGLVECQASHRTVLPLRFNEADRFMLCGYRAPLKRGQLFEFSNVLPHAYFNRGTEPAVLLVTTFLQEDLLPVELNYAAAGSAWRGASAVD